VAATFLFDLSYQEPTRPLDRAAAERIAKQRLLEMFEEGERMGWEFGSPPQWQTD
jgi:hypothetical protein